MAQNQPSNEQRMKNIEQIVAIVGDKWSLLILGKLAFVKNPSRFNELMKELKPISSRTLSIKLIKLSDHGIIEKAVKPASPPYTNYALTEKGKDLVDAFSSMVEWNLKWLHPVAYQNYDKNADKCIRAKVSS